MSSSDTSASSGVERFAYDDAIVRKFAFATVLWGFVGMLVGVIIALQLAEPWFNRFGLEAGWLKILSFGRLRPLHTNAVIFAFSGQLLTPSIKAPVFCDPKVIFSSLLSATCLATSLPLTGDPNKTILMGSLISAKLK